MLFKCTHKRKLLCTAITTVSLLPLSGMTLAQQDSQIEEIVVSGIRSSLQQSLDRKRNAANFVDAITAEDIGAFPDQNLAESLQRISGVGIDRQKGEGAFLTVRGLGPDFVQVTNNGRALVSNVQNSGTGDQRNSKDNASRIVGFDQYQSGLVQAVEVYKSPQANHFEGGLGGVVEIQTRRPIDIGRRVISLNARAMHTELSGETDPSLFGLFSDTFADDTLGFMISAQWDDRALREDETDITRWVPQAAKFDLDKDGKVDVTGFHPNDARATVTMQQRERLNVSSALQWQPNERVDITWDLLYSEFDRDQDLTRLEQRIATNLARNVVDAVQIDDNGTNVLSALETVGAQPGPFHYGDSGSLETISTGVNFDFEVNDRLNLNFDIALSDAENINNNGLYFGALSSPMRVRTEVVPGSTKPVVVTEDTSLLTDPANFATAVVNDGIQVLKDEELQLRADAEYTFPDLEFLDSIEVGVSYRSREREDFSRSLSTTVFRGEPLVGTLPFPVSDFLTGISSNFAKQWVDLDLDAGKQKLLVDRRDEIPAKSFNGLTNTRTSDISYEERITAAYAMANFGGEVGSIPFSGNFGLRYVETDAEASGLAVDVLGFVELEFGLPQFIFSDPMQRAAKNSYTDVLPSLNLRFDLRDDLILRAAVASVMSRPAFSTLNPSQSGSAQFRRITSGNTKLDPITADQLDLGLEWYFADYAIASVGVFYKKAKGFVEKTTIFRTLPDVIDVETNLPVELRVQQPVNGPDTTLNGVELTYQQTFERLPEPFNGLGAMFNYTYIDASKDFLNLTTGTKFGVLGLSENTYNASLFYERGPVSARISYNTRDEFLEQLQDGGGHPVFFDAYEQWDASVRYRLNDNVTFSLEAINLTDENVTLYNILGTGTLKWFNTEQNTGRRLFAGVQMQF